MIAQIKKLVSAPFFLLGIVLPGVAAAAAPPTGPPALRISSEITLPSPSLGKATDVRWAGEGSVYLALEIDGAVEVDLSNLSSKEMIPGSTKPGGFWGVERVAASSRFLVGAGPALSLTWRRLEDPVRVEHAFEGIQAVDVRGDRLAIVGLRRDEKGEVGKDGAIAWTGSLDKNLEDLRPLLYDLGGPGAPAMNRCALKPLGTVRYLADGPLVVIPGVQPGIHLYDSQGKLVRTWDTASLGIDTDCMSLSQEQADRMAMRPKDRQAWVNQRRTVDTLLPLDSGPGLVVRRVENGRTRWDLKLLRPDGSVETYAIPIDGGSEFFHLKGDVRSGKIVFLLQEDIFLGAPAPPRLYVARLPS